MNNVKRNLILFLGFNCPGKRGFGAEFDVAGGGGFGILGGKGFGGGQAGNAGGGGGWLGRQATVDGHVPAAQLPESNQFQQYSPPILDSCVGILCG